MEGVVEHSISVSGWCPWCEQPHVDGHYPGEMTLMFVAIFSMYSTPLEFQKMVAITLPAENVVFAFLGFGHPG